MTRCGVVAVVGVTVLVSAACGSGAERDDAAPADSVVVRDTLVMPAYPDAEAGRLVTRSDGRDTLVGSWRARAGVCAEPELLQLIADEGEIGTIVLVHRPDGGSWETGYPVRAPDSTLAAGTGRLGVQVFRHRRAVALQAVAGSVVVERAPPALDGRFAVTLRNVTTFDSVLYAGVFQGISVDSLPAGLCPSLDVDSAVPSPAADPLH